MADRIRGVLYCIALLLMVVTLFAVARLRELDGLTQSGYLAPDPRCGAIIETISSAE
jgi:hypothetical protein